MIFFTKHVKKREYQVYNYPKEIQRYHINPTSCQQSSVLAMYKLLEKSFHISAFVVSRVRNLKFATSKTLVNLIKKMLFLSKNWHFSVQKALIYYTFNTSHQNSYILLVFSHVANFRYVANFRFLTL